MLRVRLPETLGTFAGAKIEFTREKSDCFNQSLKTNTAVKTPIFSSNFN